MRKKVAFGFGVIALGMSFSGCGKNLPALSADQKAVVKDTMTAVGRTSAAPQGVQSSVTPSTTSAAQISGQSLSVLSLIASRASTASTSSDSSLLSMQSSLTDDFKNNTCSIQSSGSATGGVGISSSGSPSGSYSMKVAGDKCPISMNLNLAVSGSSGNASVALTWDYAVSDPAFRALNDVDSIHLGGSVNLSLSSSQVNGSVDIKGKVHSQKQGDINIIESGSVSANSGGGSGDIDVDLIYPKFEADFRIHTDGSTTVYYLNNQEITASDFQNYLGSSGINSSLN
ncbi:MAG: hypothetical protein ACXWPM_02610 [Bdellovibrionota bacterium]